MIAFIMTIENEDDRRKATDLYERYGRTMLYIARGILKDHSLAEDAVSEAFVRIIDNLEKINAEDCYRTKGFVVVIVRNVALNMLRSQNRHQLLPYEDFEEYAGTAEPVFETVSVREACAKITEAISGLNKSYSDILYLRYEMEYTGDEIARILGVSPENARMRLSRARRALLDRLRKEEILHD